MISCLGAGDTLNDRDDAISPLLAPIRDLDFQTEQAWRANTSAKNTRIKGIEAKTNLDNQPDDRSHLIQTPNNKSTRQ